MFKYDMHSRAGNEKLTILFYHEIVAERCQRSKSTGNCVYFPIMNAIFGMGVGIHMNIELEIVLGSWVYRLKTSSKPVLRTVRIKIKYSH